MRVLVGRAFFRIVSFLLPRACPFCLQTLSDQSSAEPLCPDCIVGIRLLPETGCCPRCALPFIAAEQGSHLCGRCIQDPPPFSHVYAVGYHDQALRRAIHQFKFHHRVNLDLALGCLLERCLPRDSRYDLIVPVPLNRRRLRMRGYNQSLLLARQLGRRRGIEVAAQALIKVMETQNQQELGAVSRRINLKHAFFLNMDVANKHILLVDDVMTTGETAKACSALLRRGGAASIEVVVLGRAVV
jgi:ComF family protein